MIEVVNVPVDIALGTSNDYLQARRFTYSRNVSCYKK